jgi:hypothetical protein
MQQVKGHSSQCGDHLQSTQMVMRTESCVEDIKDWLNFHCMHPKVTSMINIVSPRRTGSVAGISVDEVWIPKSVCVKDLRVLIDQGMTMQMHVQKVCKAAYASQYSIGHIRKYLHQSSRERLIYTCIRDVTP